MDRIASSSERKSPAATAPSMAAPSRTGSAVAAMATSRPVTSARIWRTRRLCACAAADDQRADLQAAGGQSFHDLARTAGQPAQAGDTELDEARIVAFEAEAGDHRARIGISLRRAVAEELRHYMDIAGEHRDSTRRGGIGKRQLLEKSEEKLA